MPARSHAPAGPLDALARLLELLVMALLALLLVDVLWGVFSRYIVGRQSQWTEELAINLLLWVSLFGAALTYRERGHLGVDYFVGKLSPAAQRLAALIAECAVLIFGGFALLYGGGMLVAQSLAANQVSPAMGWKVGYFYGAVPITGVFFVLFSLEHLWQLLRPSSPTPQPPGGDA